MDAYPLPLAVTWYGVRVGIRVSARIRVWVRVRSRGRSGYVARPRYINSYINSHQVIDEAKVVLNFPDPGPLHGTVIRMDSA